MQNAARASSQCWKRILILMRRSNLAHTQPNSRKTHLAFAGAENLSLALLSICFVNLWQQFRPFAWKGEFSLLCAPPENFCSDWLRERSSLLREREEKDTNKRAACSFWPRPRAHISKERAASFFAAIYETCQGCVEFIDCIFADSELCSAGLWESLHAIIQPRKKCPSIVNIISLWKSYFFYWTTESPLLVVLLNVATKSGGIVYPRVHPYKIGRNKIWAFFLAVAACMRGDKLNRELNRSERGDQSPSAAVAAADAKTWQARESWEATHWPRRVMFQLQGLTDAQETLFNRHALLAIELLAKSYLSYETCQAKTNEWMNCIWNTHFREGRIFYTGR